MYNISNSGGRDLCHQNGKARWANQASTRLPFSLRTAHGPGYATENRVAAQRDILKSPAVRAGVPVRFPFGCASLVRFSRRPASHLRSPLTLRSVTNLANVSPRLLAPSKARCTPTKLPHPRLSKPTYTPQHHAQGPIPYAAHRFRAWVGPPCIKLYTWFPHMGKVQPFNISTRIFRISATASFSLRMSVSLPATRTALHVNPHLAGPMPDRFR